MSLIRYGCTNDVWLSTTTYDYGCNTESYGPIQIATNDAGLYLWLIRRPVRECVIWALYSCLFLGIGKTKPLACDKRKKR